MQSPSSLPSVPKPWLVAQVSPAAGALPTVDGATHPGDAAFGAVLSSLFPAGRGGKPSPAAIRAALMVRAEVPDDPAGAPPRAPGTAESGSMLPPGNAHLPVPSFAWAEGNPAIDPELPSDDAHGAIAPTNDDGALHPSASGTAPAVASSSGATRLPAIEPIVVEGDPSGVAAAGDSPAPGASPSPAAATATLEPDLELAPSGRRRRTLPASEGAPAAAGGEIDGEVTRQPLAVEEPAVVTNGETGGGIAIAVPPVAAGAATRTMAAPSGWKLMPKASPPRGHVTHAEGVKTEARDDGRNVPDPSPLERAGAETKPATPRAAQPLLFAERPSVTASSADPAPFTPAHAPFEARELTTGPSRAGVAAEVMLPASSRDALGDRVADQLTQRVIVMRAGQESTAALRLEPADLGRIDIQIRMQGETAHVTFNAHHAPTRDMIDDQLGRLRLLLGGSGLDLGDVNVGHSEPEARRSPWQPEPAPAGGPDDTAEAPFPLPDRSVHHLVDAYA